jgi:hypothetical protein
MAKYSKKSQDKVERAMHEMKKGKLRSGRSGKKVTNPRQAVAIGLSEAREAGAKVPPRKRAKKGAKKAPKKGAKKTAKKGTARKKSAPKKTARKKAGSSKSGRQSRSSSRKSAPKKRTASKSARKRGSR